MMGCRLGLYWDETLYYYITNLQGDVIAALDSSGVYAAWYVYDTRQRQGSETTKRKQSTSPAIRKGKPVHL